MAPFRLDEQVTIEVRAGGQDPEDGTELVDWVPIAEKIWCNTQDLLPSQGRGETTANGLATSMTRTRLRIQVDSRITTSMRAILHGKGDRLMQIVAGPALLDDRRHVEFMLEGNSHG